MYYHDTRGNQLLHLGPEGEPAAHWEWSVIILHLQWGDKRFATATPSGDRVTLFGPLLMYLAI